MNGVSQLTATVDPVGNRVGNTGSDGPLPPLPSSIESVFGSVKQAGRCAMPNALWLKAAFGELKLDLREAAFPVTPVRMVAESLCASVEVLLPEGATVVDHTTSFGSSHKLRRTGAEHGPTVYLEGWSVFSDVKFIGASAQCRREL